MATKQQVLEAISDDKIAIINGLSAGEHSGRVIRYPRAGRIASSVNVDVELLVDPDTHTFLPEDQLRGIFAAAGALTGDSAITYCGGGVAASLDALALTLLGVQDVAVYDGGLVEWTADPELPMEVDIQ
jgi:thiosulfate/3-mercaptopyruvate sulfurtransferase